MISGMLGKSLMNLVLILQSVAAILLGLLVFNIDLLSMLVPAGNIMLLRLIYAVLGLSGVLGLLEVLFGCGSCCD